MDKTSQDQKTSMKISHEMTAFIWSLSSFDTYDSEKG